MSEEGIRIRRFVTLGVLGLIILVGVSIVISLYLGPRPSGSFYHPFFPLGFGWLGGIFLVFIILGVLRWAFWPWKGGYRSYWQRDDAHDILRQRYAKGEITKEQFDQMMRDIEHKG
jgi:putative membrane protein